MLTEKQLQDRLRALGKVECVVRDHHQFKLKLGLGEEAYASLRITRHLQELWDVGGAAAGAGVANLIGRIGPLAPLVWRPRRQWVGCLVPPWYPVARIMV